MTSLVCWIGVDERAQSSAYIATDSRISWGAKTHWDSGRKAFACQSRPDLLAYVGSVLFPSLVLGQIVSAIDAGLIVSNTDTPQQRADKIGDAIEQAFQGMPLGARDEFTILYVTRQGEEMKSTFHAFSLSWAHTDHWSRASIAPPTRSDAIAIWGSGAKSVRKWRARWNRSSQKDTSRAVFSAFCDSVLGGADPLSGGCPQLVGLYRIGAGRTFGVIEDGRPHLLGLDLGSDVGNAGQVKWHNRFFERCGPDGQRLPDGKKHHVPKGLGGKRVDKTTLLRSNPHLRDPAKRRKMLAENARQSSAFEGARLPPAKRTRAPGASSTHRIKPKRSRSA